MTYLAVFSGGALGSLLREMLVSFVPGIWPMSSSLVANLIACIAIGWLYAVRHKVSMRFMHLGAVGFCGGLSTFSTFAADIAAYLATGDAPTALASVLLEIGMGLCAVVVGERLANAVHGEPNKP